MYLIMKVQVLQKSCKKDDQWTSMSPLPDWPEVPYEDDFRQQKNIVRYVCVAALLGMEIQGASKEISYLL